MYEKEKKKIFNEFIDTYIKEKKMREANTELIEKLNWARVPGFSSNLSVMEQIQFAITTSIIHQRTFPQFRNINIGKDVVICATGPTYKLYRQINDAIHIGVNHSYKKKDVEFDYLFAQDTLLMGPEIEDLINYRKGDCKKFVYWEMPLKGFDFSDVYQYVPANSFNYDIDILPLPDFTSVVFSAFAFALWTRPRRIYLVGCDCSQGHFISHPGDKAGITAKHLVSHWRKAKDFVERCYPDTEIVSINPVGLKGMFADNYTE